MSPLPAPRTTAALAALAVLSLLAGCGQTTASPEAGATVAASETAAGTATAGPPPGDDVRAVRDRTLAVLEELYDQLGADDAPPLATLKAPGAEVPCTLEEVDPDLAWREVVLVPVDPPSAGSGRVRDWLSTQGYALTWSRQGGTVTSHARDGYKVSVAEQEDGRVELRVESPCLERAAN